MCFSGTFLENDGEGSFLFFSNSQSIQAIYGHLVSVATSCLATNQPKTNKMAANDSQLK